MQSICKMYRQVIQSYKMAFTVAFALDVLLINFRESLL